jgi:hypothetical protein
MEINSEENLLNKFKDLEITSDSEKLHFLEETVNESVEFINCGLHYLSRINFANNNLSYALSFLNLSRGFELLMKCMICYKRYNNTKNNKCFTRHFPTQEEMRCYGHNLNKLRKEIMKNYQGLFRGKTFDSKMISKLKEDRDFISKDRKFIRTLGIISKYGIEGRYYELNYVTSDNPKYNENPKFEMNKLIMEILKKDEHLRNNFVNNRDNFLIDNKIWQEIIERYIKPNLNKFLEALSRQFSLGILGDKARGCNAIDKYAYLKDYKVKNKDADN